MKNTRRHVSMDAPLSSDEDSSNLYELISSKDVPNPDKNLLNESLQNEIEFLLCKIPAREAEVIRMFFGLNGSNPMSLEEIGLKFGLTRERVRQIKEKAVRRLKINERCSLLKAYL